MCRSILIQSLSPLVLVFMLMLLLALKERNRESMRFHMKCPLNRRDFDYYYEHQHEQGEYTRHLPAVAVCGKFAPSRSSGGGTGRHARLTGVSRKACRFKSRPEPQFPPSLPLS